MSAFLSDGVVSLRPVRADDLRLLAGWRNDPELRQRTRQWMPLTDDDQARWYARINGPARRDFMFVVRAKPPGRDEPISAGVVGLCHWQPQDRTAEISFYIGRRELRGCGLCTRTLKLLIRWGFNSVGLHRIWAECYAFNEPGLRLLESLGFQREGVLREHVYRNGEHVDSIMFGLLRREWNNHPTT